MKWKIYKKKISSILKIILVLIMFSYSSLLFFTTAEVTKSMYITTDLKLSISGDYIEVDKLCETLNPRGFPTDFIHSGGILFVNFTNLIDSNSSVEFNYFFDDGYVWSPSPANFTLAPGENHNETHRLDSSSYDSIGYLVYVGFVTTANSSATIRFGYQIVLSGTENIGFSLYSLCSSFCVLFIFVGFFTKRKRSIKVPS